jgi:uncharacterized membrane protein
VRRGHGAVVLPPAERGGRAVDEAKVRRAELVISRVLRVGTVTSLAVIVAGLVLGLVQQAGERTSGAVEQRLLTQRSAYPHSLGAIFSGAAHGNAVSIIALGLVVLVATPVVRVAVSVLTFVYERDPVLVAVTAFVLTVLIGSFVLGIVGG